MAGTVSFFLLATCNPATTVHDYGLARARDKTEIAVLTFPPRLPTWKK